MGVDWVVVQKVLSPIKDYEDLCQRYQVSFSFSFVRAKFSLSMPQLIDYTEKLLLGDARNRYTAYNSRLVEIMTRLHQAGVQMYLIFKEKT
jgi:hypothetical protein